MKLTEDVFEAGFMHGFIVNMEEHRQNEVKIRCIELGLIIAATIASLISIAGVIFTMTIGS